MNRLKQSHLSSDLDRFSSLIGFLLAEGWRVHRSAGGQLLLEARGGAVVYTGAAADNRKVVTPGCVQPVDQRSLAANTLELERRKGRP